MTNSLRAICLTLAISAVSSSNLDAQRARSTVESVTFEVGGGEIISAERGSFSVPANRNPGGQAATITLRYVRFASTSANPGPPIVFLAGGPGDAATRAFRGMPRDMLERLRAIADVIAFDQRGTGTSESAAICPPGPAAPLDRPLDPAALVAVMRTRLTTCLSGLTASGVDIGGLTTQESADDVDDLRAALGQRQVMLLAGSYGTHLALAVARRHPEAVARMALLGVEGPDDTVKLPAAVEQTLNRIDEAHPGVVPNIRTLLDRLRREPWTKTLPNGQQVTVGAWDLQRRVAESLDTVPEISALGPALAGMLEGDYSDLVRWTIPFRLPKPLNVMNLAMDCASYASPERLVLIQRQASAALLGDAINYPLPDVCDTPGLPRLPDAFRAPVVSAIPALLVAGTFDGRTPPANAEAVAKHLPRGKVLVIPRASHSLFRDPEAMEACLGFLREPDRK
jgi:pimeloyl-ACP methyl ester carboxylesterase